nr:hypothetical protein [Tanacetum cinerariifolium]
MFQRLGRYPTSFRVFLDPILFLVGLKPSWEYGQQRPAIMAGGKEMAFRNFIYTEDVEDLLFLPKEPSSSFSAGSPFVLVNTGPLKANEELVIWLAEVMADSRSHYSSSMEESSGYAHGCGVIEKLRGEFNAIKDGEGAREEECKELRAKYEAAITEAYEQVADMKEPFDLSNVKGYRSSYKKDHTQASTDLATVTFPWLDEFVADPPAPIEALLSKKPPSLQRPSPSRTQVSLPSFQRATSSSIPVFNLMSPPADVFVMNPQSF